MPAQRIEPGASAPDLSGQQGQIEQAEGIGSAVCRFRDAQCPKNSAFFGCGKHTRSLDDQLSINAGDLFSVFGSEFIHRGGKFVEILGAVEDKITVIQILLENHVCHCREEGNITPRSERQVKGGIIHHFNPAGINDDQPRTVFLDGGFHLQGNDGMVFGWV